MLENEEFKAVERITKKEMNVIFNDRTITQKMDDANEKLKVKVRERIKETEIEKGKEQAREGRIIIYKMIIMTESEYRNGYIKIDRF